MTMSLPCGVLVKRVQQGIFQEQQIMTGHQEKREVLTRGECLGSPLETRGVTLRKVTRKQDLEPLKDLQQSVFLRLIQLYP